MSSTIGLRVVSGRIASIGQEDDGVCAHESPLNVDCTLCHEQVAALRKTAPSAPYRFAANEADASVCERFGFNVGNAMALLLELPSNTALQPTHQLQRLHDARWYLEQECRRLQGDRS